MLAYTGNWNTSYYLATERKRLAEDRKRAAKNRAKHRKLDRRERLLKDLEAVDAKLRAATLKSSAPQSHWTNLLRRRNKLVDALNAFVGTSQKVALEEV